MGGRLAIRVTDQRGRQAEGFVSIASFADIARRAGAIGRRLFAVLAGTETPEDIAAIITWFYEDPRRLADAGPQLTGGGSHSSNSSEDESAVIAVADLLAANTASAAPTKVSAEQSTNRNWSRFMSHIFAAFRQKREPLKRGGPEDKRETEEDEDTRDTESDAGSDAVAIEKSLYAFNQLFNLLLSTENNVKNLMIAFDLTNYVSGRLRPEGIRVKEWLYKLLPIILKAGVPPKRRDDVLAAILLLAGTSLEPSGYRWARECLLQMNVEFSAGPPPIDGVSGLHSALPQATTAGELYTELQKIRTYPEQVRAYLLALNNGGASDEYGELAKEAVEEWPVLRGALTSSSSRQRILELDHWREFCPRCQISLPTSEVHKLQTLCVATAKNCCRRIILWKGN